MTTITADIINASIAGNPVNIRGLVHNDPTDTTKKISCVSSTFATNSSITLTTNVTQNRIYDIDVLNIALGATIIAAANQNFSPLVENTYDTIKTNSLSIPGSLTYTLRPETVGKNVIIRNGLLAIPANPTNFVTFTPTTSGNTNIIVPSGASPYTITFPNVNSTLVGTGSVNTFSQLQTFSSGLSTNAITSNTTNSNLTITPNGTGIVTVTKLKQDSLTAPTTNSNLTISGNGTGIVAVTGTQKVDSISANTTNSNLTIQGNGTGKTAVNGTLQVLNISTGVTNGNITLSGNGTGGVGFNTLSVDNITARTTNSNITLSGNGTGFVAINGTEKVDTITANTTNSNLSISGNGTGVVAIGANGLKFGASLSVLKDYTIGTFTCQFTCGTFNSGNKTIGFEKIGKTVTLKIPAVTGTPNIDAVFSANNLPFPPATTQQAFGGPATKNSTQTGTNVALLNAASSSWSIAYDFTLSGFGTTGTCGWQVPFDITYYLN